MMQVFDKPLLHKPIFAPSGGGCKGFDTQDKQFQQLSLDSQEIRVPLCLSSGGVAKIFKSVLYTYLSSAMLVNLSYNTNRFLHLTTKDSANGNSR
jgi:hypothetical protein